MAQPAARTAAPAPRPSPARLLTELVTALAMIAGRGGVARAIVREAALRAGDRVADIGCGPGGAVRVAAGLGVPVAGIDPSPIALRMGRLLSRAAPPGTATWARGRAENLPLADHAVTVAWSVSAVHHWGDVPAGLAEIHRVLRPGGRVLLAERLLRPGARRAAHGFTRARADELVRDLAAAGFAGVSVQDLTAGRRTMVIVRGHRAGSQDAA